MKLKRKDFTQEQINEAQSMLTKYQGIERAKEECSNIRSRYYNLTDIKHWKQVELALTTLGYSVFDKPMTFKMKLNRFFICGIIGHVPARNRKISGRNCVFCGKFIKMEIKTIKCSCGEKVKIALNKYDQSNSGQTTCKCGATHIIN